ncbi:hypothetical protein [Corallococcus sp. EGB]|uniref:hypothetical protein n=1 Tax=Corallococcus sp. EGB TaxID=1521117 RepID=UPI001CBE03E7|nr:hypothetical protein [Corallococcus sp. EGB]
MATVQCFRNHFVAWIPLDGTYYYVLGPDSRLATGSINVTVHAVEAVDGLATRYVEVIQMATRRQSRSGGGYDSMLDIVVRNNGHVGGSGTGFSEWDAYTSVITP